jgi:cation diffusion facilitator family transporter
MRKKKESPAARAQQVIQGGLLLNFFISLIKFGGGFWGNSFALIADAIESWVDFASSFAVWIGLRTASLPPDKNHPYGHGKAEPLSALVVSLVMIGAAIFITHSSIHFILTPHESPETWTLYVVLFVLVSKELLYRWFKREGLKIKSTALIAESNHQRSDALTSLAAGIGILIALFTNNAYPAADDWASLIAAAFIVYQAIKTGKTALSELMDEAQPQEVMNEVAATALAIDGVLEIPHCIVRKMGFEWFVDIHIGVNGKLTVEQGHEIADKVEHAIKLCYPQVYDVLTHIEPVNNLTSEGVS